MLNVDRLCVWCMKEKLDAVGNCEHCGRDAQEYEAVCKSYYLPPWTILRGRYLIGARLGEGGFGITYLAMDLVKEERVAIKEMYSTKVVRREGEQLVLSDLTTDGRLYYDECKSQFLLEAKILYQLEDKSGVVTIFDFFEENGTAYIVMEYLGGVDLGKFLNDRGGRISYRSAFMMLRPVMKTLIQVHGAGIIHRDVSPDNIRYLVKEKRMKILDCGSSRTVGGEESSQMIFLKSGYAPPEQYVPDFQVGPWMDVYAMSATLYRCITGKMPRPANERIIRDDLIEPVKLGANITKEQQEVILKGMALEVPNRYKDMWEFYMALKAANAQAPNMGGEPKAVSEEDEKKHRRLLLICIIWCLVALTAIVLFLLLKKPAL